MTIKKSTGDDLVSVNSSVDLPKVALIVAMSEEGRVIGRSQHLPWRIPRDLRWFRRCTLHHPIIMGRRTFDTLGCRPLAHRRNIILTRQKDYFAPGCEVFSSLSEALHHALPTPPVFIIGGGELYRQSLPWADTVYETQVVVRTSTAPLFPMFDGDTSFPSLSVKEWYLARTSRKDYLALPLRDEQRDRSLGLPVFYCRFSIYKRSAFFKEIKL